MKAKRKAAIKAGKRLKVWQKVIVGVFCALFFVALVAGGYLLYVSLSWNRISDNLHIAVTANDNFENKALKPNTEYSIMTHNIGFGAYSYDFDFFMDGGTKSWAFSEEAVYNNLKGNLAKQLSKEPDILLLQEIDEDCTRTYHINELEYINGFLSEYNYAFAYNYFKSPFFAVPIYQPHGTMTAGLSTYSKFKISSALRRSLPISNSFSKYFDLDRCYSVSRLSVDNDKELVVFNVHLSAYGSDDSVREGQTGMLFDDMLKEYNKGNYVICGGDFNHNLRLNEGEEAYDTWAYPFPRSRIPEHLSMAMDLFGESFRYELDNSCRDCNEPYILGHTNEFIVDGFIVSDNIQVSTYENLYGGYLFSDHEPVLMTFVLK